MTVTLVNGILLFETGSNRLLKKIDDVASKSPVVWSPDNTMFAIEGLDYDIIVYDGEQGEILKTFSGHYDSIRTIAWALDGHQLISVSEDLSLRYWDFQTDEQISQIDIDPNMINYVFDFVWSPNKDYFATINSRNNTISVWGTNTGGLMLSIDEKINSISWSPDGTHFVSGSETGNLQIWNVLEQTDKKEVEISSNPIGTVAWSPDGKLIAAYDNVGEIRIWDIESNILLNNFVLFDPIKGFSWSPDSKIIAFVDVNGTARIWDLEIGKEIILPKELVQIDHLLWTKEGDAIFIGNNVGELQQWDLLTDEVKDIIRWNFGTSIQPKWSPDGKFLSLATNAGVVHIYDFAAKYIMNLFKLLD